MSARLVGYACLPCGGNWDLEPFLEPARYTRGAGPESVGGCLFPSGDSWREPEELVFSSHRTTLARHATSNGRPSSTCGDHDGLKRCRGLTVSFCFLCSERAEKPVSSANKAVRLTCMSRNKDVPVAVASCTDASPCLTAEEACVG